MAIVISWCELLPLHPKLKKTLLLGFRIEMGIVDMHICTALGLTRLDLGLCNSHLILVRDFTS